MATWYRNYPDGASGTVIQTPNGYVAVYLPKDATTGTVRIVQSLALAQSVTNFIAGWPDADEAGSDWKPRAGRE
jgi:hypothetical protein